MALIDFILHIGAHLETLVAQYGAWIYAILFVIVFCETGLVVLPFLPGDSMLFAAGAIAAVGGMNIFALIGTLIGAAILGDWLNFEIGKHYGRRLFANPDSRIFRQSYLHKTEQYFAKYGGRTVVIARFIPIVRTFAPFVAGMGQMSYGYFLRYNVVGAVVWVMLFSLLGYFFGRLPFVKTHFSWILLAIIVISILPMVIEMARAWSKSRA
ncbi:DedA family protein [Faucicola atlantae]|nr:DedA family protein [Moraxella atlantae]